MKLLDQQQGVDMGSALELTQTIPILLNIVLLVYWAFMRPKVGIFIIAFSCFYLSAFASTTGFVKLPSQIAWLSDIALVALLMRWIFDFITGKRKIRKTPIDIPVIMLCISGILGAVLSSSRGITALLGFRNYFKYILMFSLIVNFNFREKFFRSMIRFFLITMAIQIPLSIGQALIVGVIGDRAGGTLFTYPLGILSLSAISIIIGISIYKGIKPHLIVVAVLLPLTWITADVIGAFVLLFPMILYVLFVTMNHDTFKSKLKLMGVSAVCIPILLFGMRTSRALNYYVSEPKAIYSGQFGSGEGGSYNRFSGIIYSHEIIASSYPRAIFGVGPGNATPGFLKEYTGRFYTPMFSLYTQVSRILAEFGYLGLALFLVLMIILYRVNSRLFRRTDNAYWKALSLGFSGMLFVYIVGLVYYPVLVEDQTAFFFWFLAAAICSVEGRKKRVTSIPERPIEAFSAPKPLASSGTRGSLNVG